MAAFQMTDNQLVTLSITATDKKGNPTTVTPGSVTWLVDNPNVLTITPSADGSTCVATAVGPLGVANVTCNATVNNVAVSGSLAVTIVSDAPTQITITPGTPTEQP